MPVFSICKRLALIQNDVFNLLRAKNMKKLCLLVASLVVFAGCSKSPPKTLEEIGGGVLKINDTAFMAPTGTMTVDIEANTTLTSFTYKADKVLRDLKQHFPGELDKYKKIWVFGTTKLVDKYGNNSSDRTVGIEWPTDELKKANLASDTLTTWQVLNLASEVRGFQGVGHDMFQEYCKEESNQKYARPFCTLYVAKYR